MYRIIDAVRAYGDSFDTPAVVVLEDRMRENISRMQAFANENDVQLRPHFKTHKSVDIAHMQIRAGAAGLTVSNLYQAEVCAAAGIPDIFLAFPLWVSESKAERIRRLLEGVRLKLGVDSERAVDAIVMHGLADIEGLELVIEIDLWREAERRESRGCGPTRGVRHSGRPSRGRRVHVPRPRVGGGAAEGAASDQEVALAAAAESLGRILLILESSAQDRLRPQNSARQA